MADIEDVDVQTDELPATTAHPVHNGTGPDGTGPDGTGGDGHAEVQAEELNFDEQFYPARPARLRPRARLRMWPWQRRSPGNGPATGDNPDYVQWLVEESMLGDAKAFAKQFTGQGSMWQNPFADPDPRAAIEKAPVWFTAYPISLITKAGHSFLGTMGDQDLWEAFQAIGITAIHTGPVKRAGGISGWAATPSVDGHFDRISTQFDDEFVRLTGGPERNSLAPQTKWLSPSLRDVGSVKAREFPLLRRNVAMSLTGTGALGKGVNGNQPVRDGGEFSPRHGQPSDVVAEWDETLARDSN